MELISHVEQSKVVILSTFVMQMVIKRIAISAHSILPEDYVFSTAISKCDHSLCDEGKIQLGL